MSFTIRFVGFRNRFVGLRRVCGFTQRFMGLRNCGRGGVDLQARCVLVRMVFVSFVSIMN